MHEVVGLEADDFLELLLRIRVVLLVHQQLRQHEAQVHRLRRSLDRLAHQRYRFAAFAGTPQQRGQHGHRLLARGVELHGMLGVGPCGSQIALEHGRGGTHGEKLGVVGRRHECGRDDLRARDPANPPARACGRAAPARARSSRRPRPPTGTSAPLRCSCRASPPLRLRARAPWRPSGQSGSRVAELEPRLLVVVRGHELLALGEVARSLSRSAPPQPATSGEQGRAAGRRSCV